MTERYFYTDPLAAAWMAKHFGMKYQVFDYGEGHLVDDMPFEVVMATGNHPYPLYIHPDSVKLLEPIVGDIVEMINGLPRKLEINTVKDKEFNKKIIQRNGIAFTWPELEK